ncbi:hypothetical protein Poly30_26280 [Planctomycetes bacterium Poly30]|uniref:Amidohydrolase-related domain-containing protein n=1 Tax=Saltatorellus ferox TaxID=2528018 RepID=A0A518ESP6_9BACT|nr:hypothetical protein Poly30_26280 [Planctomycetes bacterium Poly30]
MRSAPVTLSTGSGGRGLRYRWPLWLVTLVAAAALIRGLGDRPRTSAGQSVLAPALPWIVVGARLIVPHGDTLISRGGLAVLGRGARIEAVGDLASLGPLPEDVVTIDGTGGTLLPGLMDAWCVLRDPTDLDHALAAGVTTLRVMDSPGWLSRVLDERDAEGIPTPRCVAFGRDLRQHVARNPFQEGLQGEALREVIEADVARQTREGVAGFTLGHDASPEVLKGVLDATYRHRLPLSIRTPGKTYFRRVLNEGDAIGSIETYLGDWLRQPGKKREPGPPPTVEEIARNVAWAVEAERVTLTGLVEFMTSLRALESEPALLASDFVRNRYDIAPGEALVAPSEELARVAPLTRACWSQAAHQLRRSLPASFRRSFRAAVPLLEDIVRQLDRAGATLVVGTGAGAPYVRVGRSVVDEIVLLCEMGLSPPSALVAATSAAAAFIGLPLVGELVPEGVADLILVDGDPLVDPAALETIRLVARAGVWSTRESLDARLASNQTRMDREIEFVVTATIDSIGGSAEDAETRLARFVEAHGVTVRRETVETMRDIYESADVPRPEHAQVLRRFLAKHFPEAGSAGAPIATRE